MSDPPLGNAASKSIITTINLPSIRIRQSRYRDLGITVKRIGIAKDHGQSIAPDRIRSSLGKERGRSQQIERHYGTRETGRVGVQCQEVMHSIDPVADQSRVLDASTVQECAIGSERTDSHVNDVDIFALFEQAQSSRLQPHEYHSAKNDVRFPELLDF